MKPDRQCCTYAGYFLTNIFHPNVSKAGEICVNTLKRDWSPTMGLRHILVVVRCLLIEPNPESALNEEAGKLLLEDYQEYFSRAQLMTSIHAQPQRRYRLFGLLPLLRHDAPGFPLPVLHEGSAHHHPQTTGPA